MEVTLIIQTHPGETEELEAKGFHFIGAGVSGGEEGALKGPSIMPGGSIAAWPEVKDIFQKFLQK